jgi:hypothetical protein
MKITLTHNIIVNDGNGAKPRKSGESLDLNDNDAKILIRNKQAVKFNNQQKA